MVTVVRPRFSRWRRFRDRAMRSYGGCEARLADPSLTAADRLATSLAADTERFKALVDPD